MLINELGLMEPLSDVMVLLVVPPTWGRDTLCECLRICFEKFGVAGVYVGEVPVLAALGCAQANGIVIDFGHEGTDVSVIWDGHLIRSRSERYPVGGRDIDQFILKYVPSTELRTSKEKGEGELLKEACNIYFEEREGVTGLHHLILSVIRGVEAEKRPPLLDAIIVTGLASQLPSLKDRLIEAVSDLLPVSEYCGDHQSNRVTVKHVPEYYPEVWQAATPVAAWFGAGITAKMVFPDSKAYYTREEYSPLGAKQLMAQKPL